MFYAIFTDGAIVYLGRDKDEATEVFQACSEQSNTEFHTGIRSLTELSLKYDAYLILISAGADEEVDIDEEEAESTIQDSINEFMNEYGLTKDNLDKAIDTTANFFGQVLDKSKVASQEVWNHIKSLKKGDG